jgi:isocitrate/isopropylmalate dehydrogenase
MSQTIAVIRGDGIGPEIMDASLGVLDAMKLGLQYEFVEAGNRCGESHSSIGKRVEVLEGLAAGARYAAKGSYILKSELSKLTTEDGY